MSRLPFNRTVRGLTFFSPQHNHLSTNSKGKNSLELLQEATVVSNGMTLGQVGGGL